MTFPPSHPAIKEAFICLLLEKGGHDHQMTLVRVYDELANYFQLTAKQRKATYSQVQTNSNSNENYWKNAVRTAKARLIDDGILHPNPGHSICKLILTKVPPHLLKKYEQNSSITEFTLPDELSNATSFYEGTKHQITVNAYERNSQARQICIDHYGSKCIVCEFNFADKYGKVGDGYIHVHHIKPLSEISERYQIDPIQDLRPVCPNCHAMLHRNKPAFSIDELKNIIHEKQKSD